MTGNDDERNASLPKATRVVIAYPCAKAVQKCRVCGDDGGVQLRSSGAVRG